MHLPSRPRFRLSGGLPLSVALLMIGCPALTAAVTRVVLGPFVAEEGQPRLAEAGTRLVDSIQAELLRDRRFEWIGGPALQTAVTALTPSNGLFVSSDVTLQAGRRSGADWLVNGAIVTHAAHTQLWVRVVDLESSTVTDIAALPFDPTRTNSAAIAVATLVRRAGLLTPKQHFIVLGPLPGPRLEGLSTALEKHYRAAGYEVVSAAAAASFLHAHFGVSNEEIAGTPTRPRLKLLPAFWQVEAGDSTQTAGSSPTSPAVLRVQRLGGVRDEIALPDLMGPALADVVSRAVERAMEQAKTRANASAALWQSEMHRQRALERVDGPPLAMIPAGATDRRAAIDQSMRTRAESTRASFEIALAQNPNDLEAKYWVGYANVFSRDPAEQLRGRKLLEEVAAGNRPDLAERARRALAGAERYHSRQSE